MARIHDRLAPASADRARSAFVAPRATGRALGAARTWLELHAVTVGYVIALLLGIALLRNGIAGLTS
jgi:hypothetical protein